VPGQVVAGAAPWLDLARWWRGRCFLLAADTSGGSSDLAAPFGAPFGGQRPDRDFWGAYLTATSGGDFWGRLLGGSGLTATFGAPSGGAPSGGASSGGAFWWGDFWGRLLGSLLAPLATYASLKTPLNFTSTPVLSSVKNFP